MTDALDGKINLIVTKSVSRFARNTVDSLITVRKLKEKGVEIYFEKEGIQPLNTAALYGSASIDIFRVVKIKRQGEIGQLYQNKPPLPVRDRTGQTFSYFVWERFLFVSTGGVIYFNQYLIFQVLSDILNIIKAD